MDECIDEDGFCNIHSLLNHYKIPLIQQEKRELITLKQGDILIFLECLPHYGGSAHVMDNMRLHLYAPIKNAPVMSGNIVLVPSKSRLDVNMFEKKEIK